MKFKKRPVEIEAIQWNGSNIEEIDSFIGSCGHYLTNSNGITIETLEGLMLANVNDWIVRGIAGEYYPVKPDIFIETYEPLDEVDK